ncbi:MAG: TadE family protein [Isosphaeraceae bacterium]
MACVEFAIILPVLVTLLLGVWDFGRLIAAQQNLSNAAREAGRQISTAQRDLAGVRGTVEDYLRLAGLSTTGLTLTVKNETQSGRADPVGAMQLDQFSVELTLPSSNVRLILLNSLLGTSTLRCKTTWASMVDIPLNVPSSIPFS